jgi:hypothetical protein
MPIPVTDVRPGDLIDVAPATRIRVAQVATIGDRTYVLQRETGALVPTAYTFPAGRRVELYGRTA